MERCYYRFTGISLYTPSSLSNHMYAYSNIALTSIPMQIPPYKAPYAHTLFVCRVPARLYSSECTISSHPRESTHLSTGLQSILSTRYVQSTTPKQSSPLSHTEPSIFSELDKLRLSSKREYYSWSSLFASICWPWIYDLVIINRHRSWDLSYYRLPHHSCSHSSDLWRPNVIMHIG